MIFSDIFNAFLDMGKIRLAGGMGIMGRGIRINNLNGNTRGICMEKLSLE
jgi:hypothetical protein